MEPITYESYHVYIDTDRNEEFRELVTKTFGSAIELSWQDTLVS